MERVDSLKKIFLNKFISPGSGNYIKRLLPGSDVSLALSVVVFLSILILPLPTFVLDVGLSFSVTLSILILMVSLFLERPLDFTSFPTLLLLTTLFRLSLEVATTRLILSRGHEGVYAAGHVVAAFGGFLMGGDVVIGIILFIILLVVNFMVITKGAGRIAEVAARFSLDSMPGKQMAIDAELASGLIDDATAKIKRKDLEEESGFYGAMDGAAKFVRGDAIASLIITAINILGGLCVGVIRYEMSVRDAVTAFTTLTIGDGLVSQIPALLVSTASGIVVTKGGTEGGADVALVRHLGGNPKPLALAALSTTVLALMPGLPAIPFLILAAVSGSAAWSRQRSILLASEPDTQHTCVSQVSSQPELPLSESLKIDLLRLELGFNLLAIANGDAGRLTEKIKLLRRNIALEMGFVLPPVRIQDNLALDPDAYVISIKEIFAGRGEVRINRFLAMDPKGQVPNLEGESASEPAFGLPALWIDQNLREKAIMQGYTVVDPASVIITHLTEIIKENMSELLSYSETQKLLDEIPLDQKNIVSDLVPSQFSIGVIQRVLQGLLEESVSIRDIVTILEALQEGCSLGLKAIFSLVEHIRLRLSRQICSSVMGVNGYVPIITLSPEWEVAILQNILGAGGDRQISLPPSKNNELIARLKNCIDVAAVQKEAPVLLVSSGIRRPMRRLLERISPSTPVLSQDEIYSRIKIKTIAVI